MSDNDQRIFRRKTIDRISSPERLNDYLRVTNPGVWVLLAAVILLLSGIFAWSIMGTLETTADVKIIVEDHAAVVVPLGSETLTDGMPLRISGEEYRIAAASLDEYGRSVGNAEVWLPDGTYDGIVVTGTVHPISFLLESR